VYSAATVTTVTVMKTVMKSIKTTCLLCGLFVLGLGMFASASLAHHGWASERILDSCQALSPEQLETTVPGTYGSILETVRHLVGSDGWYLFTLTHDRVYLIEKDRFGLPELRAEMETHGAAWSAVLADDPDPDRVLTEIDEDDGYRMDATFGIRLAQALHHGTDHRSQVCTALTALGVPPPDIDVWTFGAVVGRVEETYPTA
jgi:uncharacterized damage-inducible protein DinB